jgi:histidine triad (HIT) family protein
MDCIFCKIIAGKIPGDVVYQDEDVSAFRDINPQAPVHILIIPRKHIQSLATLQNNELPVVSRMVALAKRLAEEEGIAEKGYRLVINTGLEGGQIVSHLHLHLLGGQKLDDKLG